MGFKNRFVFQSFGFQKFINQCSYFHEIYLNFFRLAIPTETIFKNTYIDNLIDILKYAHYSLFCSNWWNLEIDHVTSLRRMKFTVIDV